ncbi:hypothetical protein [Marinomonas ostreistagni]|uniref:hypothetical protein n=1 Tax=Marinomonas ostreistagni TaxID=359209 RepID=UPI00194E8566|nr:hypothetical protein [Marinomonas ostreistagni]MBM6552049.1 hypothetical protein [Marinomonas ostreistagni]
MKTMMAVALMALTLTGCSVHRVAGEVAGVDVEASRDGHRDGKHHDGGGDFCPPGQAKKGNC